MILSVHIPKTAGNSFLHALNQIFNVYVDDDFWNIPEISPEINCIHGHGVGRKYDDIYPWKVKIGWIRNPVDRVISNYFFDRNGDWDLGEDDTEDKRLHIGLREGRISLREYAKYVSNVQPAYIHIENVEKFAFIGIVERYPECLSYFSKMFNGGKELESVRYNVNPEKGYESFKNMISSELRKHVASLNKEGIELYRIVEDKWKRLLG